MKIHLDYEIGRKTFIHTIEADSEGKGRQFQRASDLLEYVASTPPVIHEVVMNGRRFNMVVSLHKDERE